MKTQLHAPRRHRLVAAAALLCAALQAQAQADRATPGFRLPDPARAREFLLERGVHVTGKPEGVRISTHFYNSEEDVDACVAALVAYRERLLL